MQRDPYLDLSLLMSPRSWEKNISVYPPLIFLRFGIASWYDRYDLSTLVCRQEILPTHRLNVHEVRLSKVSSELYLMPFMVNFFPKHIVPIIDDTWIVWASYVFSHSSQCDRINAQDVHSV